MKLWLISQTENDGYDTYDCAVVAARTEEDARKIHPRGKTGKFGDRGGDWASEPEKVQAKCIGNASNDIAEGSVICASFNAG